MDRHGNEASSVNIKADVSIRWVCNHVQMMAVGWARRSSAEPLQANDLPPSGLPERTFKRRFMEATGFTPIDYVQRLRIEDAKRRLEGTDEPADEISWRVGYEDTSAFPRLFKRVTRMTPGAYRRRFQVPTCARSNPSRSSA
jgi:transcriptional regulator GlxA family with amidase domain